MTPEPSPTAADGANRREVLAALTREALAGLEEAKEKVQRGEAFVITSQAIGALNEDGSSNS